MRRLSNMVTVLWTTLGLALASEATSAPGLPSSESLSKEDFVAGFRAGFMTGYRAGTAKTTCNQAAQVRNEDDAG